MTPTDPHPLATGLRTTSVSPVLDLDLDGADTAIVDLSHANPNVVGVSGDVATLAAAIAAQLDAAGARVGLGGYLEIRDLYRASPAFGDREEEPRCVHLGVDLWAAAGTVIHAPLGGTIHSFRDNRAPLDYGPTIIVAHHEGGLDFFTLYGHLSRKSLAGLTQGQDVPAGRPLARMGPPHENGGWPPHLHLQIITELRGHVGDFPGACTASEVEQWRVRCPNPNLLLRTQRLA